ncbi:hypothetical protein FJD32_023775 (plasmid) [Shewanella sp. LC6]|uniref:hypothetical protein n=1 Tax=unclassified Shewanella TaxID=196818 RepID=UPI000321F151|nr:MULTISPECIES: hypothetical protein [unclassified Shewanella]MCB2384721.1 hypothetical protein [Shewanella sp. SR1]QQK62410.1 hypothetical protein FJD32_023775 [Shewanella sp. LC6]TPE58425.1 hypothetical protein FJD33_10010 [Shewanella sp. LC2]
MFAAYLVIGVFGFVAGLIVLLNKGNPLPAAIPRAASLKFIPSKIPCVANQYPEVCDDDTGLKRRTGAYHDYLINPATGLLTLNGALDVAGNPLGADLTHSGIDSGHDFDHDFGMNRFGNDF